MILRSLNKLVVGLSLLACSSAFATPFTFDVTGVQSYGGLGATGNSVYEINVGANATITSVSYNVNVTALSPSYLSEFGFAFTDSDFLVGVLVRPGLGFTTPGTQTFSEEIDLVDESLSFAVNADGILRLEFYETFNDPTISPDGIWNFGTITFNTDAVDVPPEGEVPEPASGMLIGAGLAVMGYTARRRRNSAKAAA